MAYPLRVLRQDLGLFVDLFAPDASLDFVFRSIAVSFSEPDCQGQAWSDGDTITPRLVFRAANGRTFYVPAGETARALSTPSGTRSGEGCVNLQANSIGFPIVEVPASALSFVESLVPPLYVGLPPE